MLTLSTFDSSLHDDVYRMIQFAHRSYMLLLISTMIIFHLYQLYVLESGYLIVL